MTGPQPQPRKLQAYLVRTTMTEQERSLQLFLRVVGGVSLLALVFVVAPRAWMEAIHQWLGMGRLPEEPVVGYLARSTSAFYAFLGGLVWVVSCDLRRHRLVLRYLGVATILFGLVLTGVDWLEGMPRWWALGEGPLDAAFGVVILALSRRAGASEGGRAASVRGGPLRDG